MKKPQHPYKQYENDPLWNLLDKAVGALARNGDIDETTSRKYIVGFLCEKLAKSELLSHRAAAHQRRNGAAADRSPIRASA